MLATLASAGQKVGLQLHGGKTKLMGNSWAHSATKPAFVDVLGMKIEVLPLGAPAMYLGRMFCVQTLHDTELTHRLEKA